MDVNNAVIALSALSQETRLRLLKLLIQYGKTGAPAGFLSKTLKVPHNTLSFHLSHLSHAGLISSRRESRSIIYKVNSKTVEALTVFLMENCCVKEKGSPSECAAPAAQKMRSSSKIKSSCC